MATFLCHRGNFYQQTFGTAMGSPVSVTVALTCGGQSHLNTQVHPSVLEKIRG